MITTLTCGQQWFVLIAGFIIVMSAVEAISNWRKG
jgi:hypothetical protein